ncbi:MAG TPA: glutamate 5-kinase [Alphaproteobacteria bacterium]
MNFERYNRVVIKVGSALLVDKVTGKIKADWMKSVCDDIAMLKDTGKDVVVVSSGAIAMGRRVLKISNAPGQEKLTLPESQAAASVGQIALASAWRTCMEAHNLEAGQLLLTREDTENGVRAINAQATLKSLFAYNAVPVINENDAVATEEIRYGDNDNLAARVAVLTGADLLILLSDINGLYTANPMKDESATFVPVVEKITPDIIAMAGEPASSDSRGGMITKIQAGQIATANGCDMIIASGKVMHPIRAIGEGEKYTFFHAQHASRTAHRPVLAPAQ